MRKVAVSRMRERYAQTVRTFRITYVYVYIVNAVLLIASVVLSRRQYMVMNTRMADGAALQFV